MYCTGGVIEPEFFKAQLAIQDVVHTINARNDDFSDIQFESNIEFIPSHDSYATSRRGTTFSMPYMPFIRYRYIT